MVLKLIAHGDSWDACYAQAKEALAHLVLKGVTWNQALLNEILNHPIFMQNKLFTRFLSDLEAEKKSAEKRTAVAGGPMSVTVPFPGEVHEVVVKPGDSVKAGDVVLILSAMKMYTDITAPCAGKVTKVHVEKGQQVADGGKVAEIASSGEAAGSSAEAEETIDAVEPTMQGGSSIPSPWDDGTGRKTTPAAPLFKTKVRHDDTYKKRYEYHEGLAKELADRLATVSRGGGKKAVELLRKRNKLLPRERIAKVVDPGTVPLELSALAAWDMYDGKVYSASIVTAIGLVHGRECMLIANDSTVKGGAMYPETLKKQLRAQQIALDNHLPTIYLVDGGGAKLDGGDGQLPTVGFVMGGLMFKQEAVLSGKGIPQIACVFGMSTAGAAYVPAMCDENIIVKGNGTVYLGGPALVKAATGEDANEQDLGGGLMHTSKSGVIDHLAEDEADGCRIVRNCIANLAGRIKRRVPEGFLTPEPPKYPTEELLGIVPADRTIPFDVREVIARIVDGSRIHEFKARYGTTLVSKLALLFHF
jgi:biotin carboxyl carrier protein/acetyl-CoA carboxylase beta subunit